MRVLLPYRSSDAEYHAKVRSIQRNVEICTSHSPREISGRNCRQLWVSPPNLVYQLLYKLAKTSTNQKILNLSFLTVITSNQQGEKNTGAHVPVKLETFRSTTRGSELSLQAVEGSHQSGNFTPGRFGGDDFHSFLVCLTVRQNSVIQMV